MVHKLAAWAPVQGPRRFFFMRARSFELEEGGAVSAGAVWTPLTNGVVTVGSDYVLTNAAAATTAFYRLRKP